jgi:hypothetical protein
MPPSLERVPKPEEIVLVKREFLDCLAMLETTLKGVSEFWSLGGDIAENLQGVRVEPDHIEVVTTREGAVKITELLEEYHPTSVEFVEKTLPRDAELEGKGYPVYTKCYHSRLELNGVKVEIYGDLQYKVNDWEWGDKLEFGPIGLYVVDKRLPVTPLEVSSVLYTSLGWTDRAEMVQEAVLKSLEPSQKPVLR